MRVHICIAPTITIEHEGEEYPFELTYLYPVPLDSKGEPRSESAGEAGDSVSMQAFGWLTGLYMELGRLDLTPIIESCAGPFSPLAGAIATSVSHLPTETPHNGPDHLPGCYARPWPEGRGGTCSCDINRGTPPAPVSPHDSTHGS